MAYALEQDPKLVTLLAGADLSAAKNLLVIGDSTDGRVVVATATTDVLVGVVYENAEATAAGTPVRVAVSGIALVKAGGTVTRFTRQMFVTGAKCVDATGNVQTLGVALASGVSGDLIPVLIRPESIGTA